MKKRKRVGLTLRIIEAEGYKESRDAISHDWISFIEKMGYVPILVPNTLRDPEGYFYAQRCDALFLTNGEDVLLTIVKDDDFKGTFRDVAEAKLLRYATRNKIPVIGICRGMQLMNIYFGGRLTIPVTGHVAQPHAVDIVDADFQKLYSANILKVNSYHRTGVARKDLPGQLVPWAIHGDIVEAFYHRDYPIVGMQWHPERDTSFDERDRQVIEMFIEKKASFCKNIL